MAIKFLNTVQVDTDVLYVNTANDRVGIGTTNPSQKLHVSSGKVLVDVTSSVGTELVLQNLAVDQFAADKNYHEINFITSSTSSETTGGYVRIKAGQEVSGNDNRSYLGFWTAPDDGTVTEKMRIDSTGNVGIGTTSPSAKLNVVAGTGSPTVLLGRATGQASIKADTDSSGHLIIDSSTGHVYINNYVNKNIYLANGGGNVGIGTTSPGNKLEVVGSNAVRIHDGTDQGSIFFRGDRDDVYIKESGYQLLFGAPSGMLFELDTNNNDGDVFNVMHRGSSRMYINGATGNVGIGTTSPNHKLDIYSNENIPLRVHRPSNANLNSGGAWGIGFSTRGDAANSTTDTRAGIFSYYNGNLFLAANNSNIASSPISSARLTILNNGRVGIGTISPGYPFSLENSDTGLISRIYNTNADGQGLLIRAGATTSATRVLQIASSNDTKIMTVNSNGRVGIGTTNPAQKLQVNGGSIYSNGGDFYVNDNRGLIAVGNLIFKTFDSGYQERMRITTAGNVGIGITAPLQPLSIEKTVSPLIKIRCTTNGGGAGIEFNDNGTSATSQNGRITYYHSDGASQGGGSSYWLTGQDDQTLVLANNGRVVVQKSGSASEVGYGFYDDINTGMYRVSADALGFSTGGTRRLDMNSSGVRIGTGSRVTTILDQDNMSSDSNTALATQQSIKTYVDNAVAGVPIGDYLPLSAGPSYPLTNSLYISSSGANGLILKQDTSAGSNSGRIFFQTDTAAEGVCIMNSNGRLDFRTGSDPTSTSGNIKMVLTNAGNVGIGTTNPQGSLHVVGPTGGQGSIYVSDKDNGEGSLDSLLITKSGTTSFIYNRDSGDLRLGANDQSSIMSINSAGNVGIGTTSPNHKLDIESASSSASIRLKRIDTSDSLILLEGSSYGYLQNTTGPLGLGGSNDERDILIDTTGNVGIGTTSPSQKLDVSGIIAVNGVKFLSTIGSESYIWNNTGGLSVVDDTGNTVQLRIKDNGNVGIGTTNPRTKLHVTGLTGDDDPSLGSSTAPLFVSNTADSYGLNIGVQSSGTSWLQSQSNSSSIAYDLSLNPLGGNVGVGTTSPSEKLVVDGKIRSLGGTSSADFYSTGNDALIVNNGTQNLKFWNNGSERMRIKGDGNVGIGTTSPSSKLQVAGGIQMADDTDTASASKVGTMRYRTSGNNSYVDMCMQTGATTYAWINIVQNNW